MKLEDFLKTGQKNSDDVPFLNASALLSIQPLPNSATEKIQKYAISVANTMDVEQTCLKGVRSALEASGVVQKDFFEGLTDAYQAIERFQQNPNFIEIDCDTENLDMLPPGAIVVWDHGEKKDAPSGHISIAKGDGMELSDHMAPQNVTGDRPNRNEKYGKKHVFFHKNSFEYIPGLVNRFDNRLATNADKLRASHILLLLASLTDNYSVSRVIELYKAYKSESLPNQSKDVLTEKQLFINIIEHLINMSPNSKHENYLQKENIHQMFIDTFDSFDNQQQLINILDKYFADTEYIKLLKDTSKTFDSSEGIRAFVGKDNQVYIYEVSKNGKDINFGYNSHGDKKLGLCAAVVKLLYKIKDNAVADKKQKDTNLGNEIISILSLYYPFVGHDLIKLYQLSLMIDTKSSAQEKEIFEKELSKQITLFEGLQEFHKKTSAIKQKFKSGIRKIREKLSPKTKQKPFSVRFAHDK